MSRASELVGEARSLTRNFKPIIFIQEVPSWTDDALVSGFQTYHEFGNPCAVLAPTSFPILFHFFHPTCTGVSIQDIDSVIL